MANHVLRLITDRLGSKSAFDGPLPAANRVLYVAEGMATVTAGGAAATLAANSGRFHTGEIDVVAGAEGAVLLRYELIPMPQPDDGVATGQGIESQVTLDAVLALDDEDGYLMRCDKVELPPGGIAYTHTHQGGGIRCLLKGAFHVTVDDDTKVIAPHEAWFEAGPDPVYAWAPDDQPGHFSRVMILPRRLQGQSSIRYVNAEDADKPKLQKYTIFVDAFIDT
jgi:quercetin dioxygenase-like cupin family protein